MPKTQFDTHNVERGLRGTDLGCPPVDDALLRGISTTSSRPATFTAPVTASAGEQSMKAITIEETGGPEVLRLVDLDTPEPGPGEILIRVAAAGVNYTDVVSRQGIYLTRDSALTPAALGTEVAGTVVAVGGEREPRPGTRVALVNGGYAEYAIAPARSPTNCPSRSTSPPPSAISCRASPPGTCCTTAVAYPRGDGARALRRRAAWAPWRFSSPPYSARPW